MPPSRLRKLRRLIRSKGLEPARVKKAAAAAEGLCRWVLGVEGYCRAMAFEASGALSKGTLRQAWEAEQQTDESWHLVTEDDIEPPAPVAPPPQNEGQAAAAWRAAVLAKEDIHAQLAVLEPIVESLASALDSLDKAGLTELAAMPSPSAAIVGVTSAVLILTAGKPEVPKDLSWAAAKRALRGVDGFLAKLKAFDKDSLSEVLVDAVERKFLTSPSFSIERVMAISPAAVGLCAWCINICKYFRISEYLAPKRAALLEAEKAVEATEQQCLQFSGPGLIDEIARHAKLQQVRRDQKRVQAESARLRQQVAKRQNRLMALRRARSAPRARPPSGGDGTFDGQDARRRKAATHKVGTRTHDLNPALVAAVRLTDGT